MYIVTIKKEMHLFIEQSGDGAGLKFKTISRIWSKKQNKMLVFLVCGLTLLFTPNGKFEDLYVPTARGSFGQKIIRDHHT